MNRLGSLVLIAGVSFVTVMSLINSGMFNRGPSPEELELRNRRRDFAMFLNLHAEIHGTLPYDERGADYALYALRNRVEADRFLLGSYSSTDRQPGWDDDKKKLIGGDILYLNKPGVESFPSRLVALAEIVPRQAGLVVSVYSDGARHVTELAADEDLLGAYVSEDDFLIDGLALWQEFTITHQRGSSTSSSNVPFGPISTEGPNHRITYRYEDGKLHSCTVIAGPHTVQESFSTDQFGRITNIRRAPENWTEIVPLIASDEGERGPLPPIGYVPELPAR
ncbi:MAG: hypothetical protein AB8G99_08660 [Planctomycetaceae bacterium]